MTVFTAFSCFWGPDFGGREKKNGPRRFHHVFDSPSDVPDALGTGCYVSVLAPSILDTSMGNAPPTLRELPLADLVCGL